MIREVKAAGWVMGKLEHGSDLLGALTRICEERNVRLGRVELIGAVQKVRLAFYDQKKKVYGYREINEPLEITSLVGNVSLRDGKPMVHAHVNLANEKGEVFGGHLAPGSVVFAAEFCLQIFTGAELRRGHDEVTGLPLWSNEAQTYGTE